MSILGIPWIALFVVGASAVPTHARMSVVPSATKAEIRPAVVLQRYEQALANVVSPSARIFEYAVEQAGFHNIEQTHRIYLSGGTERDETLAVDGRPLPVPSVRIFKGWTDRYGIIAVAPRLEQCVFTFVKAQRLEGYPSYVFRVGNHGQALSFTVDGVTIDGRTFLPTNVQFRTSVGAVQAAGQLSYARFGRYWLIREASVTAVVAGKPVREVITWSAYQFPTALPVSTFSQRPHLGLPVVSEILPKRVVTTEEEHRGYAR